MHATASSSLIEIRWKSRACCRRWRGFWGMNQGEQGEQGEKEGADS